MLDIYKRGKISRMSPEAPVPVLLNVNSDYKAGGAANVAVNLANMGLQVAAFGVVGKDENAQILQTILSDYNVEFQAVVSDDLPTITKTRIIGNGHHILRIDTEKDLSTHAPEVFELLKNTPASYAILSDYNKGSLADIQAYIQYFQNKNIPVLVDPKREISAYAGAWFVKPNRHEFTRYIGEFTTHEELFLQARKAIEKYDFKHMLVTLGDEGMMYVCEDYSRFFPAQTQQVADITGAGDTVLSGLVYGLTQQLSIEKSIELAQRLAEVSVTQSGTYVIRSQDVQDILKRYFKLF